MATSFLQRKARDNFAGAATIRKLLLMSWFRRNNLLYLLYVGLAAIGIKIIAVLWLYFSWSPEISRTQTPDSAFAANPVALVDAAQWQSVIEQNWFGHYQPTTHDQSGPVAETKLNVLLRGIAWGANPAVVIEEGGQQYMYRAGDALTSYPATVGEIFPDHLLLYYQGETERLSLTDSETSDHRQAQADADGASVEHL